MTLYRFQFTDRSDHEDAELQSLAAARSFALTLAATHLAEHGDDYWDGRSIGITVGIAKHIIFTIFLAVLHCTVPQRRLPIRPGPDG